MFHLAFLLGVIMGKGTATRECKFHERDCKGAHISLREMTREAAKSVFSFSPITSLRSGGNPPLVQQPGGLSRMND